MRSKIFVGTLLSVFVLLTIPCIPALEYHNHSNGNKLIIFEKKSLSDIGKLKTNGNHSLSKFLKLLILFSIIGIPILLLYLFKTPMISFTADYTSKMLRVESVNRDYVLWGLLKIDGECDTSDLSAFVEKDDVIRDCNGTITVKYIPTNITYGEWNFL